MRTLVIGVCGVAVTGGLAGPALADQSEPPHRDDTAAAAAGSASVGLAGLELPDRTAGHWTAASRRANQAPGEAREVVVAPGDSLWSIATNQLPADASDTETARLWRSIQHLNTHQIGTDPDLIFPGTTLKLPAEGSPDERNQS